MGLRWSYFLDRTAAKWGRPRMTFGAEAMALLESYDYPGNVRELENAIEHAVTVAEGTVIEPADLPAAFRAQRQLAPHAEGAREAAAAPNPTRARHDATAPEHGAAAHYGAAPPA